MTKRKITVLPGDGIGPTIVDAALKVLDRVGCDFEYALADAGMTAVENGKELLPQETLDLLRKNKIALKGPITTPVGEGFKSINVTLRQTLYLYANVRPVVSFPGNP